MLLGLFWLKSWSDFINSKTKCYIFRKGLYLQAIRYSMKNYFFLIIVILLSSCANEEKKTGGLYYKCNVDDLVGWVDNPTIIKNIARSGVYCAKTDSLNPYSLAFVNKMAAINDRPLKKCKYSAWVLAKNLNIESKLVTVITDPSGQNLFWNGSSVKDFVKKPNEWVLITGEIDLSKYNMPNNVIRLFGWNMGKEPVYFDDFELEFFE
jgi:hypothetical protein